MLDEGGGVWFIDAGEFTLLVMSLWLFSSESLQLSELPFFPFPLWVFTCFARWSDLMKRLLQMGQANLFSPVCVRRCLCNSSDLVNLLPQNSQLQTNGLSPVCHLKCAFKCDVLPYTFPQPGMWQLWMFFFLKCTPAGPSLSASWQLGQSQVALPVYLLCDLGDGTWGGNPPAPPVGEGEDPAACKPKDAPTLCAPGSIDL